MIRIEKVLAALTALGIAAACSDKGTGSVPPGPPPSPPLSGVVVALATPNSNDGAAIVTLTGPDVGTLQAADSHYVVFSRASGQDLHVIVVGNLSAGPLFTAKISGTHTLSAYSGSIQQVATRGDSVLGSLSGYQLNVTASP